MIKGNNKLKESHFFTIESSKQLKISALKLPTFSVNDILNIFIFAKCLSKKIYLYKLISGSIIKNFKISVQFQIFCPRLCYSLRIPY